MKSFYMMATIAAIASVTSAFTGRAALPKPGGYEETLAKRQVSAASLRARNGAPRLARRAGPSPGPVTQVLVSQYINCPVIPSVPFIYDSGSRPVGGDAYVYCQYGPQDDDSQQFTCQYNADTGETFGFRPAQCPASLDLAPSTGVYCFTACPSRAANFASLQAATVSTVTSINPILQCDYSSSSTESDGISCQYNLESGSGYSYNDESCPIATATTSCITTIDDQT